MSRLFGLFGTKYEDERLILESERALTEDPRLGVLNSLGVSSQEGVVTVLGSVSSEREKRQVEEVVRNALKKASLEYERVVNEVAVS